MPRAEYDVDAALVRALLRALPEPYAVHDPPLVFVGEGWDNSVWRVGDEYVARVARRSLAAPMLVNEARWLDDAAAPLVELGVRVPSPVHLTPPGRLHPLPWLLTTWVDGVLLADVPVPERTPALDRLADALPSMHRPAPPEAPHNPFRGRPISELAAPAEEVVGRARAEVGTGVVGELLVVHRRAARAPRWPGRPRWVHGDLHPLNLVLDGDHLGVLDFGDLTAGDPAVDLGVLWTGFDREQRAAAITRLAPHYDADVWERARGWAARLVIGVLGNDPSRFHGVLEHALPQVLDDSASGPMTTGRDASAVQPLQDPS